MKVATILPQAFLHFAKNDDYHMALGHLVGKEGFEAYTQFFAHAGKNPDKYVILDTGLIEGNARPVDELLEKAMSINADEMALNDVFMNHTETLRESYEAMAYVLDQYAYHGTEHPRLMVIPQGATLEEWVACAKEMLKWPVQTIGVPKVLTKLEGRDARLKALMEIQEHLGDKEVHLLGCWETPLELKVIENATRAGHIKPVRGCDSAIAYAYAREGIRITDDARPEGAINFAAQHCDLDTLQYNIDVWKKEAATLPPISEARNAKVIRLY